MGKVMKYRDHRGLLADSLDTTVEIPATKEALIAHLNAISSSGPKLTNPDSVTVEKYGHGIDKRCGWDTHIVAVYGCAVGFTDGPLADVVLTELRTALEAS
jgi:hypothetical protein